MRATSSLFLYNKINSWGDFMNYYIGMDIGTSSTKAVLFDTLGNIIGQASYEYDIISLKNGYAEQNPLDWKNASIRVLKDMTKLRPAKEIKGIGLSGQMHGLVLLDKYDNILDNAIIWCDNRTQEEVEDLKKFGTERLKEITGNDAMPAFTLAKLLWVKKNKKDIYQKIDKIMLPKDYIRYVLTHEFKTEYSDASGMQMMDIRSGKYSCELLNYFGIEEKILPKIVESQDITGTITSKIASDTGLLETTFVVGGASDQAASALGNGIVDDKKISITLGSSGVVFQALNELNIKNNGLQYFRHAIKNTYHTMAVTNGCGNSLKWYKDNLCEFEILKAKEEGISTYDYLTKNIDNIPAGSNGLIFLPYIMGERTPHLDPAALGVFVGLRGNTSKDMMTKAIIEGISYSMKDCFNLLDIKPQKVLISGGGARNIKWIRILASMLNVEVSRTKSVEAGSLGVAILAMCANNEYKDIFDAVNNIVKINDTTKPLAEDNKIYEKYMEIYKLMYEQNKIIFEKEKEINV